MVALRCEAPKDRALRIYPKTIRCKRVSSILSVGLLLLLLWALVSTQIQQVQAADAI
jgi:hypothetical protein